MASLDLVMRIVGQDKTGPAIKSATDNVKGLGKASEGAKKAADSLKGALAGLAIGAAAGAFFKKTITAASDLEQAMGSLEAVFGANTDAMTKNAKAAAKIGLSQAQYAQSAAVLGAQLGNLGIRQEDLGGTTDDLVQKAADMAAQFGGSTAEALEALGSLMRGERDPVERFGVTITDAGIKAEMAATGLDKTQATLSLLNKQLEASGTIGAAAREMNTLAGSTGRMRAEMENAAAQLGGTQLPVMAKLADMVGKLAPELADALTPAFEALGTVALDALTGIESNMPAIREGIADFGDKLKEIGPAVERNWPQIKETFNNVAAALERVGQFTQMVWDAFKSLPPEVQQLLALLAVAQKTGALKVAFSVADFFKQFMTLTAGVVNVNGPVGGVGGAAGAAGKGGAAAGGAAAGGAAAARGVTYLPLLGPKGTVIAAVALSGYAIQQAVTGQSVTNLERTGGNPNTLGGMYGAMGGTVYQDTELPKLTKQQAEYREAINKTNDGLMVQERAFLWVKDGAKGLGIVFAGLPEVLGNAISSVTSNLQGIADRWEQFKSSIGGSASAAAAIVSTNFTLMKDNAIAKVSELAFGVKAWFENIGANIRDSVTTAWSIVAVRFQQMKDSAVAKAQELWSGVTGWFDNLSEKVGGIFSGMVANIGAIWNGVTDVVRRPISLMFGWINRNMIIPINNVLGRFSDKITLGFLSIGAYADGGYVTGPGGPRDDRVPAMLSNGEFVVNAQATKANRVWLEALNAGKQGFGIGNFISDIVPDWFQDVLARGAGTAIRFVGTPAVDTLERLYGGEWSPNVVVAGMRHVLDQAAKWGDREDAAVTGEYKGPRGAVQRPLNTYAVTSEWMRSGADMRHFGIDLGAPTGTPIFAAANGRVIPMTTSNQALTGGYGIMATIDHGNGLKTLYAHMSQLATSVGQIVRAGQRIGAVGSTGQSTGPHLHFETHQNGRPVNPRSVLSFDSGGWLMPGMNLAYNGTSEPEPVLTSEQWRAMNKQKSESQPITVQVILDGRVIDESLVRTKRANGGVLGLLR